jgi:PPOX class probable F420-dependent enzyme
MLDERIADFVARNRAAVMATLRRDGSIHVARISVGLVDGEIWSSGTQTRVRTRNLRRDPRATLTVLDEEHGQWLGLETEVTILDGPDAVENNLRLYQTVRGADPPDLAEYRAAMVKEQRLIYRFEPRRAYGRY